VLRAGRRRRLLAIAALLALSAALGAALQRYWMELSEYSFLRPELAVRWLALTLLAETAVAAPWAAARGALGWQRLVVCGHMEEYRRSRLTAAAIAAGAIRGAVQPVLLLLGFSAALALGVGLPGGEPAPGEVLLAHALLAAQAATFAALGVWLAGRLRHPALAIPAALAVLAAAITAIRAVDPLLRAAPDPSPLIYAALLPNPVTAVGAALNTDVLRFGWVYQQLHTHEYFFVYPPAWQTALLYLVAAGGLGVLTARRVRRGE
jgi:hypothetical protein